MTTQTVVRLSRRRGILSDVHSRTSNRRAQRARMAILATASKIMNPIGRATHNPSGRKCLANHLIQAGNKQSTNWEKSPDYIEEFNIHKNILWRIGRHWPSELIFAPVYMDAIPFCKRSRPKSVCCHKTTHKTSQKHRSVTALHEGLSPFYGLDKRMKRMKQLVLWPDC